MNVHIGMFEMKHGKEDQRRNDLGNNDEDEKWEMCEGCRGISKWIGTILNKSNSLVRLVGVGGVLVKFENGWNRVEIYCTGSGETNGFTIKNWAKVSSMPVENDGCSTNCKNNIDNQQHYDWKKHPKWTRRSSSSSTAATSSSIVYHFRVKLHPFF